jgi:dipeptidyl aminopeptidase/acylaminoacyl peptidase
MIKLFALLMFGLALTLTPAAAQPTVTVEPLSDVINMDGADLRNAVISPDASMLAWSDRDNLCLYSLAEGSTDCTALPELYRGQEPLAWSPDGAYLAFTENFFTQLREPDIWLFDVEAGMFINRTDDGQVNNLLRPPEGDRPRYIDTLPTWNPVTGDLYFFRSEEMELFGDDIRTTQLMRIAAEDVPVWAVEPEEVRNLTLQFDIPFSIYNPDTYTLNGALAFSPDGARLAMLVRPNDRNSPNWGLWLLDIERGDLDRLATVEALNTGLPDRSEMPLFPDGLAWSGENLVVSLYSPSFDVSVPTNQAVYVDVATGDVTPLFDFTDIQPVDLLNVDPATGVTPYFDIPRVSTLTPDGESFLYLNFTPDGVGGLSALALPPRGAAPERLWETEPQPPFRYSAPSAGQDAETVRVVIGGYLVTLTR